MAIITISRGSFSRGKEIAEKLAEKLNYKCVSREILLGTCGQYNVPEIKLTKAIRNAPSFWNRFSGGKTQYINRIRATLLDYAKNDDIVYHGLAGQFFLKEIPNVLKVCLIADIEYRIKSVMGTEKISYTNARNYLKKIDEERIKWGKRLYGINTYDPILFDLVIYVSRLTTDDATDIIQYSAKLPCFQSTPESQDILKNTTIRAQIIALLPEYANSKISVDNGKVEMEVNAPLNQKDRIVRETREVVERIEDVKEINVILENKGS